MNRINWGIMGCAGIAIKEVIPAMLSCKYGKITAIASRNLERSREIAEKFRIPESYGSYEDLLSDKKIDAVYIPLPNHMHVDWAVKAMEAGKHVLCEKPLALTLSDIDKLIKVRDRTGMKISEAFMVRSHPQWIKTREFVQNGDIGELKAFQGFFSYYNRDSKNIRNIKEFGGGSIWDIGCYPINTSRYIFGTEPEKVMALMEFDPEFGTDYLASAILKYPEGHATFTSSTQSFGHQRVTLIGTKGKVEIEIPFNAPVDRGSLVTLDGEKEIRYDICNQYTLQGDNFAKAVLDNGEVPVSLEDSLKNSKVILALFESAKSGQWVEIK